MARKPLILDMDYKTIRGFSFKQGISGVHVYDGHSLGFNNLQEKEFSQGLLTTFINKNYKNITGVYINLPYETSFVREFILPFTDKKKIREIFPFELERLLSFSLDEIIFDYYSYSNFEKNETYIIALGCTKKSILPYLNTLYSNNIPILGIYSPLDSLFHLFTYTKLDSAIILHVAAMNSMVVIIHNHKWIFARNIPFGYDNLVYWLSSRWKKSFEESEQLFIKLPPLTDTRKVDYNFYQKNFSISKSHIRLFMQSIEEFSNSLQGELMVSIKSGKMHAHEDINEDLSLVVSSDLNSQSFLESILSRKFKKSIIGFPYERTPLATVSKEHTICFGGAIAQSSKKGLNFMPKEFKKYSFIKNQTGKLSFYITTAASILFFMLSLWINLWNEQRSVDTLREQNKKIYKANFGEPPKAEGSLLESGEKKVSLLKIKTDVFSKFFRNKKFSELIIALDESLPKGVELEISSLVYNAKNIHLRGNAPNSSVISEIESNILDSEYFESSNCSKKASPGKKGTKRWKLNCKINLSKPKQKEL